ncbi:MAG: aminopeptidase N [Gammaproteobacteria bacterium]|jgi:aminopeptidase N
MSISAPAAIRLDDYTVPPFLISTVHLHVDLFETHTDIRSVLQISRNPDAVASTALTLNGYRQPLLCARIDGQPIDVTRYQLNADTLTISNVPEHFELELRTTILPQENTALEGLYKSSDNFCTQCEAQGFRRITWFLDRPDVMSVFTTTISADKTRYPVLLSNGNPTDRAELDDGRHAVTWHDPYPKPSYLFALVAGDLADVQDTFTTRSGREVALHIYVEHHNRDRCAHAMNSLIKAMQWDEQVYALEYDLDIYMIVAVDDFNMGAMENKGLNVFNSKYVLARPDTATDSDFAGIEGVIAHEYFHNWTGNRVTCRDWFQLSLKEGLTVFRDQQFSADMGSPAVKRIQDVRVLRSHQFAEDAGPMAHPVRPDSYIEISNFYTVTIYNKGAEVIRMMQSIIGEQGFQDGMRLYFERHDGQAVTTEDFVCAMEDATATDLGQFRRWYSQAGTPIVDVRQQYDKTSRELSLTLTQRCCATPGQTEKLPFHIPLRFAFLDRHGTPISIDTNSTGIHGDVIHLREQTQTLVFTDVDQEPVLSLGRGFSAPIKLNIDRSDEDFAFLIAHDNDPFNRWDAAQNYSQQLVCQIATQIRSGSQVAMPAQYVQAIRQCLSAPDADKALLAEVLALPSEGYIADQMDVVDVDAIHQARQMIRRTLAWELQDTFQHVMMANQANEPYAFTTDAVARRALKNLCLSYLMELDEPDIRALCVAQLENADNMTDQIAALQMLANSNTLERDHALSVFEQRWRDDPLVMDKWFSAQATAHLPETLTQVQNLLEHPGFDRLNPNRVRALISAFCQGNPLRFNAADGSGYRFAADQIIAIDAANPQLAARLLGSFGRWRRYDESRQMLMRSALERVQSTAALSKDAYEIVSKTLEAHHLETRRAVAQGSIPR